MTAFVVSEKKVVEYGGGIAYFRYMFYDYDGVGYGKGQRFFSALRGRLRRLLSWPVFH